MTNNYNHYYKCERRSLQQITMSELQIVSQKHLVYFDDTHTLTSIYLLKVTQSASAPTPTPEDEKQLTFTYPSEDPLQFEIWSEYSYTWNFQSDFLTCKEVDNHPSFGSIPFSLETYMQMFRDVRLHKFLFEPKAGVLKEKLGSHESIGKIIFKTHFKLNPFIFPLRVVNSEAKKSISIVVPEDEIAICSGELMGVIEAEEVEGFISKKGYKYLRIFNYEVSGITDAKIICVLKGTFESTRMEVQGVEINIMHPKGFEVQNLSIFKDIFVRLFGVMKPKSMIVVKGVETKIECAEGIMFWSKNCLNLFERIFKTQLLSKIKDQWIIQGMITYKNNYRHLHSKFMELCDLVKKGEEFAPLIEDEYSMDEVWRLKSTVMYHIFTHLTHQEQKLTHTLISSIKEDRKMTTQSFYRTIKNKYGIASLNQYNQFIKFTGITKFNYEFSYTKKENKVKVRIRQKPIQSKNYQDYNSYRIKLEENFDVISPLIAKIIEKNEKISGKDSWRKRELMGPLLVPAILRSNTFVKGKIPIILAQTNESQVREENFNVKVAKKKVNKENLNCRNKLRKTINKKGGMERELGAQPSWMKLDPTQTYLFSYFNENVDEIKLLKQLMWEENEMELFRLLQNVKKKNKDTAITEQLCKMLEIKETNRTSLAVRQEILNVFHAVLSNSEDRKPWDTLLNLLRLYEPPFYDRSLEGHHLKISLLECASKLKVKEQFIDYFQEFHRIMLGMSRDNEVLFSGKQEIEFRKTLYKSMLSWRTKHTLQILNEIHEATLIYLFKEENFGILKMIVERVYNYDFFIETDEIEFPKLRQLKALLKEAMQTDNTHKLQLVQFNNMMCKAELQQSPVQFFIFMYYKLEEVSHQKPQIYVECLKVVKNILSKNKKKYALEYQINVFNTNQNYFVAERLWEKLTTGEALYLPSVRLQWMKIYRIFYFYFTPVAVIHKIKFDREEDPFALPLSKEDRQEMLENIKDFTPDIEWFSGYDITNKKQESLKEQDREEIDRLKQKKIRQRNEVNLESTKYIARKVKENPEKEVNWQECSKYMLEFMIAKHENRRTSMEVINELKAVKKKLKRGNTPRSYTFEKLKEECWTALEDGNQDTGTLSELIKQIEETLKKVVIKRSDTEFILPIDVLKPK